MRLRSLTCIAIAMMTCPAALADRVKPWTPPKTTIPAEFVATAKALFGIGIEDPRGGTFSRLLVGQQAGATAPVDLVAFGWAMGGKRFISTNGTSAEFIQNDGPASMSDLGCSPRSYPHPPAPLPPAAAIFVGGGSPDGKERGS